MCVCVVGGIHWSKIDVPGGSFLRKTAYPYPSIHQLPIAPSLGLGTCELLQLHARMSTCLILCKQLQSLWVMSAMSLPCSEDPVLLEYSLTSGSYGLSISSTLMFPEPWGLEVWYRFPAFELALHSILSSYEFLFIHHPLHKSLFRDIWLSPFLKDHLTLFLDDSSSILCIIPLPFGLPSFWYETNLYSC